MDRPGTCIIILDKKYNIANSSCHFGSYGSIWTGPSPKKYDSIWTGPSPKKYMDLRSFGPYNIFLVRDRSIYCHMTLSAMNYLLYINGIVNFNKNICNKPCQCRNTDYWANDLLKVHQQRYRLSNHNKNVDI